MKQILEQFKYLNPKDPGAWPPLPKALALLVLQHSFNSSF